MKHTLYRIAALLLAVALVLSLVGCGKQPVEPASTVSYAELMSMMNQTVESGIHDAVSYKAWWGIHNERLWTCGMQPGGFEKLSDAQLWIASCDAAGEDVVSMQLQVQPDPQLVKLQEQQADKEPELECVVYQQLYGISFDSAGAPHPLLMELVRTQDADGAVVSVLAEQYTYCTIGADGQLVRGPVLQLPFDPLSDLYSFSPDSHLLAGDDALWVCVSPNAENKEVYKTSTYLRFSTVTGECTAQLALPDDHIGWDQILTDTGDILLFARQSYRYFYFFYIQGAASDRPVLSERIPFVSFFDNLKTAAPLRFVRSFSDASVDPCNVLVQGDGGIWSCNVEAGTVEKTVTWLDYGLQVDAVDKVYMASPQQFLVVSSKKLRKLTLLNKDAMAMREVVTFAVVNYSVQLLQEWVEEYNANDPPVYIKILDYTTETAEEKGYYDGAQMLLEDIRYGKQPDILMLTSGMDTVGWSRKGMLLDLYPYLDADPQLSREDFAPAVLKVGEYEDRLPSIIATYGLLTAVASRQTVGDVTDWSWQQYDALCDAYPQAVPFFGYGRHDILHYMLQMGGSKFIDHETGHAYLDSPAFIQLLKNCAAYPEQGNYVVDAKPFMDSKEYLLYPCFMGDFRTMLKLEYFFDGPVSFVGFPSDSGDGSVIYPGMRLAISSSCKNPDAAWAFLRTFLLEEYQSSLQDGVFPLRRDSLLAKAAAAQQPETREFVPEVLFGQDYTAEQLAYWKQGLTQAQTDQIIALLDTVDTMVMYDETIINIIWEEADYFYSGVRTAEEAAAIMQNRVQTYLDEQS